MWFLFELLWPPTLEGRSVNSLLFILCAVGVTLAVQNLRRVRQEQAILDRLPAGSSAAEGEAPPTTLPELLARLGLEDGNSGEAPRTALGRRLRDLWQVRGVGRSGVEALAEAFSSREAMGLDVSRYLTSILVLLGLAGTIWGLHDLLGDLTRAAGQNSYGGLVQALRPMKTAFSCTFVGILTSVILAGILGYVERRQNDFILRMEELVTLRVISLIFPPSATRQLQRMETVLARSGDSVREFGEAMARGQELFRDRLTEAMTAAGAAFATSLQDAGKGLESSLGSVASQVQTAIRQLDESLGSMEQAGRTLGESARSLLEYREELKQDRLEMQELLRETNQSVIAIVERAVAPLERGGDQIETAAVAMTEVRDQLVIESRQQETMIQAFVCQSGQERALFSDEARRLQSLFGEQTGRGLDAAAAIREAIEAASTSHGEAAQSFDALARAVQPESFRLPNGQMLGERMGEISERLENVAQALYAEKSRDRSAEDPHLTRRLQEIVVALDRVAAGLGGMASNAQAEAESRAQLVTLQRGTLAALRDVQRRMNQPLWRLILPRDRQPVGEIA